MAAAVLKAWNAPSVVAEININLNGKSGRIRDHKNTIVHALPKPKNGLAFTHLDGALPWPIDRDPDKNKDMQLALKVTDVESTLNQYILRITGLPAGDYLIKEDGIEIAHVSNTALGEGVDLAALPELAANKQASDVLNSIRKHNNLHFRRWRQVQFLVSKNNEPVPADV